MITFKKLLCISSLLWKANNKMSFQSWAGLGVGMSPFHGQSWEAVAPGEGGLQLEEPPPQKRLMSAFTHNTLRYQNLEAACLAKGTCVPMMPVRTKQLQVILDLQP